MGFSDYLIDTLGDDYKISGDGKQYMFRCPFCTKNYDHKLYVKRSFDSSDGLWQCKRCWRQGNPAQFVMEYENVTFPQAMDNLELYGVGLGESYFAQAEESGLSLEETIYLSILQRGEKGETQEETTLTPPPLPYGYKLLAEHQDDPEAFPFIQYLINQRGIDWEDIQKHNIGYIIQGGVELADGRYVNLNNHVVFLTHDNEGNYVYWNTRSIEEHPFIKTFNAPSGENHYSKSTTVFNLNLARYEPEIVLTEGVLDAITIGSKGVAGFGKQYSDKQLKMVLDSIQTPQQKVILFLDKDANDGVIPTARKLVEQHPNTYIVNPPTGEDPNDLGRHRAWKVIREHAVQATTEGMLLSKLSM